MIVEIVDGDSTNEASPVVSQKTPSDESAAVLIK